MKTFADKALGVMRSRYPDFPEPDIKHESGSGGDDWVRWVDPITRVPLLTIGDGEPHWIWQYALYGRQEAQGVMIFPEGECSEPSAWLFRRICEIIRGKQTRICEYP